MPSAFIRRKERRYHTQEKAIPYTAPHQQTTPYLQRIRIPLFLFISQQYRRNKRCILLQALSLQAMNRTLSLYGATQQRRIPALLPNGFLPILPKEHNNRRKRKGAHNTDKKRQGKRTYRNKATERQRPER